MFINYDTLNGLFIGNLGVAGEELQYQNKIINGFAFGIFVVGAEKVNGIMTSIFMTYSNEQNGFAVAAYNKSTNLHGFQFGLINYAGNNRKIFRWMPLINFNLRKKPAGNST